MREKPKFASRLCHFSSVRLQASCFAQGLGSPSCKGDTTSTCHVDRSYFWLWWNQNTNLFLLRMNFQIHAHIQKLGKQRMVQKNVYSNSLFPTHFLQVSEDVDVCEDVHHHRDHLQGQGEEEQAVSPQHHHLTAPRLDSGPHLRGGPHLQHHFLLLLHIGFTLNVDSFLCLKTGHCTVSYKSALGSANPPPKCLSDAPLHTGKFLKNIFVF